MMEKNRRRNVWVAFALGATMVLVISTIVNSSSAQNTISSQTLEVSPPSQEISVDPGQTVNLKAKVRNKSANTINLTVRIEDFTALGEEGQVALTEQSPYSLTSWTKIDPSTFILKSGETKEVIATVAVPDGSAGGRYGSFVFSIGGGTSAPGTASVSQEVASLFLLRISGPVTEQLTIDTFSAPGFLEFGPVPMVLKFKNKGNVHVRANGLINIRNMFGKTTADVVFRGENVFPGASRVQNVVLNKQWLFGPYTAQAVLSFGSKNESITATTSFFVFPVRILAAIVLVLVVVYLMRKRLRKAVKALIGS